LPKGKKRPREEKGTALPSKFSTARIIAKQKKSAKRAKIEKEVDISEQDVATAVVGAIHPPLLSSHQKKESKMAFATTSADTLERVRNFSPG
jgi:hypothetical protein